MKLARVAHAGGQTVALFNGRAWIDYARALQAWRLLEHGQAEPPAADLRALLETEQLTQKRIDAVLAMLDEHGLAERWQLPEPLHFLLPLEPGKIIAVGRNYAAHAQETGFEAPEEPIIFAKSPSACIGDGESIIVRESYGRVDHEAELALVIGRRARYVAEEEACDYIAGYTILNDVTARGIQQSDIAQGLPWFRSKSMDTFCPLGPAIALPGSMPWPVEADITLRVNGDVRQQSNTREFIFSVPELLSFVTRFVTLEPGDIIATGTPDGISALAPGDLVEIDVPPIGTLRNPVAPSGARLR